MEPLPPERAYKRFSDKFSVVRSALELASTTPTPMGTRRTTTKTGGEAPWPAPPFHPICPAAGPWPWTAQTGRPRDASARPSPSSTTATHRSTPTLTLTSRPRQPPKLDARQSATDGRSDPDGRAIYTTDRDARAGYRTATRGRKGGPYIGSEVHLAVQVRDFSWSGDATRVNEGQDVPGFVREARLVPAGTHRAHAIVPMLASAASEISKIVWDRGYSILPFETAHGPLRQAGIQTVFDLSSIQRDHPAVTEKVIWIDGHPFHEHTPEHLLKLDRPLQGANNEQRAEYQTLFNERARWRWTKQAGPDADGVTRWICPFHAGRLKSRSIRQRKVAASAPLVQLPAGVTSCCTGTLTLSAGYLNLIQADGIPYGTSAHAAAYGRRQIVETDNSYLGGAYINLERSYSRLMGHKNRKFLLGILLAGLNRYIERQWRAKLLANSGDGASKARAKRRKGTFTHLLDGAHNTSKNPKPVVKPLRT